VPGAFLERLVCVVPIALIAHLREDHVAREAHVGIDGAGDRAISEGALGPAEEEVGVAAAALGTLGDGLFDPGERSRMLRLHVGGETMKRICAHALSYLARSMRVTSSQDTIRREHRSVSSSHRL